MKLFICTNSSTERHRSAARACIGKLCENCRASFVMPEEDCRNLYDGQTTYAGSPEDCDYIVGIGGDGTVLRAAQYALKVNKPLVGINNGRLGYLCAAEMADAAQFTENTFEQMPPTERSLLSFRIGEREYTALNDVVVTKTNMGVSVQMEVCCRGQRLAEWRCDGVIVSTPTGSTAYNYSAGGPKLIADLPCFVITPICPHNGSTRSVVVHDKDPITVRITERSNKRGYVYADGVECGEIENTITLTRHAETLTLLTRDPSWI